MSACIIRIRGLHKSFGDLLVLRGVDLDVHCGERIAIIGGSGSGKGTMLRCLNFMEIPTAGTIELDGTAVGRKRAGRNGPERVYVETELRGVRKSSIVAAAGNPGRKHRHIV